MFLLKERAEEPSNRSCFWEQAREIFETTRRRKSLKVLQRASVSFQVSSCERSVISTLRVVDLCIVMTYGC
jgi:hypothetical protein